MLVPKTSAATTAVIATVVPTSALRTGTAVRPRPGSNAIRTPAAPGTDPARPRADPSRDGGAGAAGSATPSGPGARAAARKTPGSSNASGSRTVAAKPTPGIPGVTPTPGSGSARRAGPIGISGEAASATATASTPPATVTAASRITERPTSLPRVMPRARQIGYSAASTVSCRASNWPTRASAMSATSAANAASATASGLMARWVAATRSDRLSTSMLPPVSGYFFASTAAARRNAARLAPGLRRTPAWGPYVIEAASRVAANDGLSNAIGSPSAGGGGTDLVVDNPH